MAQRGHLTTIGRTDAPSGLPSLDATDRRLLWLLDLDPTAPLNQLAAELGVSTRTVHRRLHRLTASGVVRILGRTLPGFGGRLAWLVRARGHPAAIGELAAHLRDQPHARWVRYSADGGELIAGLVTAPGRRDATFDLLSSHPGLHEVRTHQLLEVWGPETAAVASPGRDLDHIDRRIMALLEVDGRMDSARIAHALGLDRSTVARRRRRLIDEGIVYFEADIHPGAIGESGDILCWITVAPGRIRDLARRLRARREVRFAAATTGTSNLAVHIVLPTGTSIVEYVDEALADPGVTAVEIQAMGRVLKRSA